MKTDFIEDSHGYTCTNGVEVFNFYYCLGTWVMVARGLHIYEVSKRLPFASYALKHVWVQNDL